MPLQCSLVVILRAMYNGPYCQIQGVHTCCITHGVLFTHGEHDCSRANVESNEISWLSFIQFRYLVQMIFTSYFQLFILFYPIYYFGVAQKSRFTSKICLYSSTKTSIMIPIKPNHESLEPFEHILQLYFRPINPGLVCLQMKINWD